jgi:hypothetical protein
MQQPLLNAFHAYTKLPYPRTQRGSHRQQAELHPCFVRHDHRLTSPSASIQHHQHDQIWHADELVDDCGFLHRRVRGMRLATRLCWLSSLRVVFLGLGFSALTVVEDLFGVLARWYLARCEYSRVSLDKESRILPGVSPRPRQERSIAAEGLLQ